VTKTIVKRETFADATKIVAHNDFGAQFAGNGRCVIIAIIGYDNKSVSLNQLVSNVRQRRDHPSAFIVRRHQNRDARAKTSLRLRPPRPH
jgi:nitrogenase subunit NifH